MIETRGRGTKKRYLVRVAPYRAKTVYTIDAARTLEANLKNRKVMGDLIEAEPRTLQEEMDARRERQYLGADYRDATLEGHKWLDKAWAELRPLLIQSINRESVEAAFVRRAKQAPVQADKELKDLKSVLREAAARGQRVDPGIYTIKPINKKPRRGWALTIPQLMQLASWPPENIRRIVPLAGMIGARQSFWFALTDDMLDLDDARMIAPAELMKNRRDHMVILTNREVALFREQLMVRPAGTRYVFPTPTGKKWNRHNFGSDVWRDAVKAAAGEDPVFDGFTFHLLRHTAGSLMAHAGLDPAVASERLGHTDGGALFLKTYRHVYEAERRRHSERFGAWVDAEWGDAERKEAIGG